MKTTIRSVLWVFVLASILIIDTFLGAGRSHPLVSIIIRISLLLIITAWWIWKIKRRKGLPQTPLTLPLITLLLVATLSTYLSIDPRRSFDGLITIYSSVLIFFIVCDLLITRWQPEILELTLLTFVGLLLIFGFVKTIQWYLYWFEVAVPEYPIFLLGFRLYGVATHPNLFATLIYISIPFAAFRLYRAKSFHSRFAWILWLLLAVINIHFIDSRGGMIATLFVILISILWILFKSGGFPSENLKQWLHKNGSIFITTFLFIGFFVILSIVTNFLSPHSGTIRHGQGTTAGRLDIWNVALHIVSSYPLTGGGLGTFTRFFIKEIPRGIYGNIPPHAHNLYLDTSAQMGILGLLVLCWLIISYLLTILQLIRKEKSFLLGFPENKQFLLIGSSAAIFGFLIHSFVDVPSSISHNYIPLMFIIAINLSSLEFISEGKSLRIRLFHILVLLIVIPSLLILFIEQCIGHSYQLMSVQSGIEEEWEEANQYLERSLMVDPRLSFYEEQIGFVSGYLSTLETGTDSDEYLSKAIKSYKKAVAAQPDWAPNILNLAMLLDSAGEYEESITYLKSIDDEWLGVWPFSALYIGMKFDDLGEQDEAREMYISTLNDNPWVRDKIICKIYTLCQTVASESELTDDINRTHNLAIQSLQNDNPKESLNILENIPIKSSPLIIWIDRAAANLRIGNLERAEFELRVAQSLGAQTSDQASSYFALTLADLLVHQGNIDQAISTLESVTKPGIVINRRDYYVFQRVGFPKHILPPLSILNLYSHDLQIYYQLADLYNEKGLYAEAAWAKNHAEELSRLLGG